MFNKKTPCWMLIQTFIKKEKLRICLLLLLCLTGAVLPSVTPIAYRYIVDQLIPGKNYRLIYPYVAVLILVPVLTSFLVNWRNISAYKMSERITENLRLSLFQKIAEMDYQKVLQMGTDSLVYRITRGCGQIGNVFLNNTLISLINASFSLVMVFVPMLWLEWRLAVITTLAFPMIWLLLVMIKKHVAVRDELLFQVLMKGEHLFHESLNGMRLIRLAGGEWYQETKIRRWLDEHRRVKLASANVHEFERVSLPELCLQVLYGVIFIAGALLVMSGYMTIGEMVAFIAYVPRSLNSIKELLMIQVTMKSIEPVFKSIDEIFEISSETSGSILAEQIRGEISFQNVCFQYHDASQFSLSDLNFTIEANEMVAIVGETGGGKSTILDLILRLFDPGQGRILMDGTEIGAYDLKSYRGLFAVVQQNHFIWNDTLFTNITYPNEMPDMNSYEDAVVKACLKDFVDNLPRREQTMLGDSGQNVSGGERQRISLAHAFFQNRPILLMDEPTSALDAQTEHRIWNAIGEYKGKKTIIVVTHRLDRIREYDRVLVIKGGKIVENDTPDRLLSKEFGVLKQLKEQQASRKSDRDEEK